MQIHPGPNFPKTCKAKVLKRIKTVQNCVPWWKKLTIKHLDAEWSALFVKQWKVALTILAYLA